MQKAGMPGLIQATVLALLLVSCNSNKQVKTNSNVEMTRLLQARLDSPTENQIVPGATLSVRFRTGQMLTPEPYETTLFEDARYGLGSFIAETDGSTRYGHTGFSPGYITYVQYLPDYNIALALQVNDDSSHDNFSLKEYFNTIKQVVLNHNYPTSGKS